MSISRLVSMDVARMQGGPNPQLRNLDGTADGARSGPPGAFAPAAAPAAGANDQSAVAATALDVLARYIPSEVIAIYIFGLSILGSVKGRFPDAPIWLILFGICIALVILFVCVNWLVLKRKSDTDVAFPTWACIAGLMSFSVWAIAIPGNGVTGGDDVLSMLAGFAALVSSHVLLMVESLLPKQN